MDTSNSSYSAIVGVKATYTIRVGVEETHTVHVSATEPARIGIAETFAAKPGDYSYSGRHDNGDLPPPREGGVMAQLIGCVQRAKQMNDEYLTAVIRQEKEGSPDPKRQKPSV